MLTIEAIVAKIKDMKTSVIKPNTLLSQPTIDRAKEGKMSAKTQRDLSEYVKKLKG